MNSNTNKFVSSDKVAVNPSALATELNIDKRIILIAKGLRAPGFKTTSSCVDTTKFLPWLNDEKNWNRCNELLIDTEDGMDVDTAAIVKKTYEALLVKNKFLAAEKLLCVREDVRTSVKAMGMSIMVVLMNHLNRELAAKCVGKKEAEIQMLYKEVFANIANILASSEFWEGNINELLEKTDGQ